MGSPRWGAHCGCRKVLCSVYSEKAPGLARLEGAEAQVRWELLIDEREQLARDELVPLVGDVVEDLGVAVEALDHLHSVLREEDIANLGLVLARVEGEGAKVLPSLTGLHGAASLAGRACGAALSIAVEEGGTLLVGLVAAEQGHV